jgi:nitroreductase
MNVTEAVAKRISIRAFKPDTPPAAVIREILELAASAPSGGNLQPWRVHALAGAPLAQLKAQVAANPFGETPEYDVYPQPLGPLPHQAVPERRRPLRVHWHSPRGQAGPPAPTGQER